VTTDCWSDWSLAPVTGSSEYITIELRREQNELGTSLWIYQILLDQNGQEQERIPLRECAWAFAEEDGVKLGIATYVARPADGEVSEILKVQFDKAWWQFTKN
jgi:regulation of enolase protein 1 (concanavalin A-like superfamily)